MANIHQEKHSTKHYSPGDFPQIVFTQLIRMIPINFVVVVIQRRGFKCLSLNKIIRLTISNKK